MRPLSQAVADKLWSPIRSRTTNLEAMPDIDHHYRHLSDLSNFGSMVVAAMKRLLLLRLHYQTIKYRVIRIVKL